MDSNTIQILIAMIIYMAVVIVIGIMFAKKANTNSESYFLGGRTLGPWVTAMSAEASDMSGWLLMGLPAFVFSPLCIVVVSLVTAPPSKEIEEDFEAVKSGK